MSIERATNLGTDSSVDLLHRDMGVVFDELNKGVDVSQIGYKAITADKMRLLKGTIANLGFGTVAAGSFSQPFLISVTSSGGTYEGSVYLQTPYLDLWADPSDTVNLYNNTVSYPYSPIAAGGGVGGGGSLDNRDKLKINLYIRNSTNASVAGQIAQYVLQLYNGDSVSHTYYGAFSLVILGTQLTGGS